MVTIVPRTVLRSTSIHIPAGATPALIVEHLGDLIFRADAVLTRDRFTDQSFAKPDSYVLPVLETLDEALITVNASLSRFAERFADQDAFIASFNIVLEQVESLEYGTGELGGAYRNALSAFGDRFEPASSETRVHAVISDAGLEVYVRIDHQLYATPEQDYLAAISELIAHRRTMNDNLTVDEKVALRAAYWLLDQGVRVPGAFPSWGTSGFRDVQTYASITDPGEGHLAGTTRETDYLHGVIVHVEHLERGISRNREELEPYRIPSPRAVARVRLHAGQAAPTSSYIGRPLLDGAFDDSIIKTTRTFAAAASSLLADGLAEVKFSVERLTASQAVRLLSSLAREVRRHRYAQTLSAAFNINTPILDDRDETVREHGEAVVVSSPESIGLLGIEITAQAGFDKVTWDGTADSYPSRCITDQLGSATALTLVHRAHEAGLLTYFSAGFRFENIPDAVVTGVDGIGIGGAQILRLMDRHTGNHGPFLTDNITRILKIREEAANSVAGRAAHILARLDRLHFEGTLRNADEVKRNHLFVSLRDGHLTGQAARITSDLAHILDLPADAAHPLLEWATRIKNGHDIVAEQRVGSASWPAYLTRVRHAASRLDIVQLSDLLRQASPMIKSVPVTTH